MDPLNVLAKFEIRSFSRSWDNRGYPKKMGSPWIRPPFIFSNVFHGILFGWTLLLFWPNLKFRSFTRSSDNSDWSLGSGVVPLERALVSSYRPPVVTFPLSLRVSDILPLLCSSTPFSHPTSSLPKISPCSPMNRWMASGLRRAKVLG